LTCKKIKSYHIRDVTCVDVTDKNNLVTGSIDNLICFWNTFTCEINKSVPLPKHLVSQTNGNSICALKFANKNCKEQILVFMNEGEVFCLDTMNLTFVQQKSGTYNLAIIKKYSLIDLSEGYCLSVSERGYGMLHKIKIRQRNNNYLQGLSGSKIQVIMEFSYEFSCAPKVSNNFVYQQLFNRNSKQHKRLQALKLSLNLTFSWWPSLMASFILSHYRTVITCVT